MGKKKLLDDIKNQPGRFYRTPCDVLRDRRFDDGERLEILAAWRQIDPTDLVRIGDMIAQLEARRPLAQDHAAE